MRPERVEDERQHDRDGPLEDGSGGEREAGREAGSERWDEERERPERGGPAEAAGAAKIGVLERERHEQDGETEPGERKVFELHGTVTRDAAARSRPCLPR